MNYQITNGSIIVENGSLYEVFKILDDQSNSDKIFHYKPVVENASNNTLTGSIPESSFIKSTLRVLSTPEEVREFFTVLSSKPSNDIPTTIENARLLIYMNQIKTIALAIKYFWARAVRANEASTRPELLWLTKSIDFVSEEVAYVQKNSFEDTKRQITSELTKYYTPHSSFDITTLKFVH